ncbi:MAG: hypothetical protein I3270_00375 [Candidatus Moeniiplasma glomeromycotorum]|nr:hypothetical protein [Candidatus Moeniiplasma glomeromycotorum]MCE8162249.1 hypothetical protein [Candidatus Moeniiplasma glomeromycotorum]MCE8166095.1 hypothetical protein [Candidatus Moeniiplasma glomeromycotorum]MCE8166648.1 hypothetical protein [Candidatus Moeniiplasma glomeromycotorum]
MLCNWCHKKIFRGEEYREKSQGYGSWSTYRGTGGGSYRYEGGGYYHLECWRKYQEWKNKWWWTNFWIKIWFGVAVIISVGLGFLFKSVLVGFLLIILLYFCPLLIIYFWGRQKTSQMQEKTTQLKSKFLTCRNCKKEYFDFYSHREPRDDYVFKYEPGYCVSCTHKLFYPETVSKCRICKEEIYVKGDEKIKPTICTVCYAEEEKQEKEVNNQEKIRERIRKEKQKK